MNTATAPTTSERPAPRPIKGSWEDLFAQAQQLARNYNDDAIALYERIFNGLMKLPPAARQAGNRHLYNMMMATGIELQGYLNVRERYNESLALIDKMSTLVPDEEKSQLVELKSDVLLQSDRGEEAIALLRTRTTAEDTDSSDWGQIVSAYIRLKQPEKALEAVDEFGAWIDGQEASSALEGEQAREARAFQERLRTAAFLELGRIDEAIVIFDKLYGEGGASAFSPHLLYTRLVTQGLYDQALRYIDRDQARPVRAAFWRGLVHRYMGAQDKATKVWEAALKEELVRSDQESIVEHVLTHYYLGDPKREGLEILLRAQREQQRISWMLFLLTGIGWLVRADYGAAHSNIKLAVAQIKSIGEGKTLSSHYWRFVKDLTAPEEVQQFAQYFDTSEDSVAPSLEPASAESETSDVETEAEDVSDTGTTEASA
jgi:hypothetical protein